jgi:hypothetical protein
MRGRWSEYRAHLITETEALTPTTRWLYVRLFLAPWFAVLLVGCGLCFISDVIFSLDELGRAAVLGPFALIGLAGMLYAGWIVMYYGVRADIRRMKKARANGG